MAAAPHALWYRTHLPPPGATVVAARNGAHVCEVAYSVPGAGVDIPGGLVHGTAPSTVEPAERERMLENMFQFVAPPAGADAPSTINEIVPLDAVCVRELVQVMRDLNNDENVPMFMYPHVHAGVDEGFKKKIRSGDAVGFERYAPRLRAALNASPSLCEFVEAHVLVQSNASACFNAHVDKLQGDNDAHPVGHATVFHLGDAMKLALFFVGGRKRRRVQRYAPP